MPPAKAPASRSAARPTSRSALRPAARPTAPPASRPAGARALARASDALAPLFAALGDPTRLCLVAALCGGGAFSIAQLTAQTSISRQGVSKHLRVLADAGVVRDRWLGRERLWALEPLRLDEAKRTLDAIGREWDGALSRLKAFVEAG